MPEGPWFQSTHPNAPTSELTGPELELAVVHPPELAGGRFQLRAGLTFGRSPDPEVVCIPHPTISRRHACVRAGMGGILCLEELGSRNGTKLNGKPLEIPMPLLPHTVVRLGDVHGVVDLCSERVFSADAVLPGTSALVGRARETLDKAAPGSAPVLVVGETGTGKERVGQELHRLSGRSGRYVALNCAELTPELIESQLFGHERGAFTGATSAQLGLFRAAHGGTLLLDEIGELPLELQPKLLRVLQEGEVRRLGSTSVENVDTRVVAATHRDLPRLVELGAFRRDLLARLSFHEIRLPSLAERRRDLLAWLEYFMRAAGVDVPPAFAPDAVERLLLHAWADNLRGLDRLAHRLVVAPGVETIGVRALAELMPELGARASSDAPVLVRGTASSSAPPEPRHPRSQAPPSAQEFLAVFEASGRSVRATAKRLGKDRRQIYRWLERFGVPRGTESD